MWKKILCILAALALCAAVPAMAEESARPVTAAELDALLETVRTLALQTEPLNDPASEDALREDGTFFQYMIAWLYGEGTALTEGTPVNVLVFQDSEGAVFRGTGIDTRLADLLAAFPLDNPDLAGTKDEAVLYLNQGEAGGYTYGRLTRTGQRVTSVEYGEVLLSGDRYRNASITYTILNGLVTSIRIDGLNPAGSGMIDASYALEKQAELTALAAKDDYRAVKSSLNGLELAAFGEEDLVFDGISYPDLQPDTLPGVPERELIDNGDGTWLMRCDEAGWEAVFTCDAGGKNAQILSFTLLDDTLEGPRGVRLGDLFNEDFCRFRNGENGMTEEMTELLYGTEGTAPWGYAVYDPDDMSLRYITDTASGAQVELLLRYENNILTEVIIHTI